MYEDLTRIERNTDRKVTIVEWTLGNKCTFACSYCPDILHDGSVGWQDHTKLTGFLDACAEHYIDKLGRELVVQYTGGEPTVYPQFKELVRHANTLGIKQAMISNGSRTHRFWREITPEFDKIHLSYHGEFADPDHFVGVCQIIDGQTELHVNILMLPNRFDEFMRVANRIRAATKHANIQLKPVQIDFGAELYPYSKSEGIIMERMHNFASRPSIATAYPTGQLRFTYEDGREEMGVSNDLIMARANQFQGWNCNIGIDTINVDMWGNIHGGLCRVGGAYGNIYKGAYGFPEKPSVCTKEWCTCHLDIMVTKSVS